jgi:hypothetical protein
MIFSKRTSNGSIWCRENNSKFFGVTINLAKCDLKNSEGKIAHYLSVKSESLLAKRFVNCMSKIFANIGPYVLDLSPEVTLHPKSQAELDPARFGRPRPGSLEQGVFDRQFIHDRHDWNPRPQRLSRLKGAGKRRS